MSSSTCVFCNIIRGSEPASIIYSDRWVVAFMDIQPVNSGHILVVPLVHAACLADLAEEAGGRLFQTGMRMARALRRSGVRCEGINLYLADGEAAGQEVFHVHLHVIPRFRGDGFRLCFAPEYYCRPGRARLDELAARIRLALGGAGQ